MVLFCSCSVAQSCPTPSNPMYCSTPGFFVLHHLLEFAQTHVHWVSDAIQPSHLLLPLILWPSIFLSIRIFSNELNLHIRWPKYCSFSFNISPSSEYSGLIFFDWLVWSPCSPRDSQESFSALWFESINSLALSFLYGPTITSVHDYWKNHSFDYIDLSWQSDVSAL